MSTYRPSWSLDDELSDGHEPTEADPEDGWCYESVEGWVTEWALPTLGSAAQTGGRRWCAQWHQHPDAVLRLTLAWKTWERAHHDPSAYTNWLLDTWDRLWAALTAADGPFAGCTPQRHHEPTSPPL